MTLPPILLLMPLSGLLLQFLLHLREIFFQRRPGHDEAKAAIGYRTARLKGALFGFTLETLFVLLMLSGGIAWLEQFWLEFSLQGAVLQWLVLVTSVMLLALIRQAAGVVRLYGVERRYGYSRQSLRSFLQDTLLNGGWLLIVSGLIGWGAMLCLGSGWYTGWVGLALLWSAFSWARGGLYPLLVAPLLNRYRPLRDPELKRQVASIFRLADLPPARLVEMDGSRRSSHGNARVEGVGPWRRIVLLDTLSGLLKPDEMAAVVAHEVGHLWALHLRRYRIFLLLASGLWVALFGLVAGSLATPPGTGLAVLWLLTPTAGLLLRPLSTALIRGFEYQADDFARDCGYGEPLVRALIKLNRHNGSAGASDPWYALFYHSHPSLSLRLRRLQQGWPAHQAVIREDVDNVVT